MTGWSAADLRDQSGRTVVITGANSGLGAVATRALAEAGARVIMACRNVQAAQTLADTIDADIEVRRLDLADLASIRAFADELDDDIDVLVNNAGVMGVHKALTVDGFESHIGINHLGPFALSGLLIDRIRDRVVTVSSGLHVLGRIGDDLQWERRRYQRWLAYAQSKLANLLFAYELQRRLEAAGRSTLSVAAHPGVTATETQRSDTSVQGKILAGGAGQSPAMGALPILYAATAPDVVGGSCVGPDGFLQRKGYPSIVRTSGRSRDQVLAARLWTRSEQLTGIRWVFGSCPARSSRRTPDDLHDSLARSLMGSCPARSSRRTPDDLHGSLARSLMGSCPARSSRRTPDDLHGSLARSLMGSSPARSSRRTRDDPHDSLARSLMGLNSQPQTDRSGTVGDSGSSRAVKLPMGRE